MYVIGNPRFLCRPVTEVGRTFHTTAVELCSSTATELGNYLYHYQRSLVLHYNQALLPLIFSWPTVLDQSGRRNLKALAGQQLRIAVP